MHSLTSDDMIYRLRQDNDIFRLESYGVHTTGGAPWWKSLNIEYLYNTLIDESTNSDSKRFNLAALMLYSGEGYNRSALRRITARGARNIPFEIPSGVHCLAASLNKTSRAGANILNQPQTTSEMPMGTNDVKDLLNEALRPIKVRLGLPESNPVQQCFRISESTLKLASAACRSYLNQVKVRGILTTYRFEKLKSELAKLLRPEHPDEAKYLEELDNIISSIAHQTTTDHLSALSLSSKNSHLLVSIVNVRGEMVSLEAWKLLRLVDDHDKQINLGSLERRGTWEQDSLLEFSLSKVGDLYAVYQATESVLHVACERTKVSGNDRTTTDPVGKASFIIDQDYLVSLYITITQLRANKEAFDALREKADARVVTNVDHLFDPCLFEN